MISNQKRSSKMTERSPAEGAMAPGRALVNYYWVGIISVTIGIAVVLLLNLFTPLQIIENSIVQKNLTDSGKSMLELILPRLLLILCSVYGAYSWVSDIYLNTWHLGGSQLFWEDVWKKSSQ
jgi:hypothetical protein